MESTSGEILQAEKTSLPDVRVIVLQVGARLHYAVPAAYARAGALQGLYTDVTASTGVLSMARRVLPPRARPPSVRRLLGRTVPIEIPRQCIHSVPLSAFIERANGRLLRTARPRFSAHSRLRREILRAGFGGANCLYVLNNSDLDLIRTAHRAGLAIVYEQLTPPTIGRVLREERDLFPGIEPQTSSEEVEEGIARDRTVFQLADAIVCPSEHVRQEVLAVGGSDVPASLVPYGISQEWLRMERSPVRGRILCVGHVRLGKGSHYLAEATRLLKRRGVPCDVRVVGAYDPAVVSRPEFSGPTYVGQVPRDRVRQEFALADVFALPSLAEGSPMAHVEALACGVPVIATPNCGSQVRDGCEGFIVPIRDADALADRLEQVVSDRALRERMSQAATERARELSWENFGPRLMAVTRAALARASQRRAS